MIIGAIGKCSFRQCFTHALAEVSLSLTRSIKPKKDGPFRIFSLANAGRIWPLFMRYSHQKMDR